jgi:Spy/CpxP family protein refolding chaperone
MALQSKLIGAAAAFGLILTFSVAGFAQGPVNSGQNNEVQQERMGKRNRRGHRGPSAAHLMRILRDLNLSEAQLQQSRALVESYVASIQPQREQLMQLRDEREQSADAAQIEARAKALRDQIHESTTRLRSNLLALLNAEQRTQFDQLEQQMKSRREERRGRRRGGPRPEGTRPDVQ